MKKVLISFLVVLFSTVAAFAAGTSGNYNGNLNVSVDGISIVSKQQVVEVADSGNAVVIVIRDFSISNLLPSTNITVTANIDSNGNLTIISIDVPDMDVEVTSFSGNIFNGKCSINLGLYYFFQTIDVTFS